MSKFKVGDMVVFTRERISKGFKTEAITRLARLNNPMKITEIIGYGRCSIEGSHGEWNQSSFELAVTTIDFTVLEDI